MNYTISRVSARRLKNEVCGRMRVKNDFWHVFSNIVARIYTGRMNSDEESSFCPLETGAIIHTLYRLS